MIKSIGSNKIKTSVFISGTGSNLQNLIKYSLIKNSPIKIDLIISNKVNAKGLKYANKYNIKKKIYSFKNKIIDEKKILIDLTKNNIRLICLAFYGKFYQKIL